ncbi:hypothetical protein NDU88_006515 [Pleurodeles waltl]|uniref:Uncharacterized protein n=1 Tax=Pleurodeles waltl TaxID=8319 RepID=A0AAV7WXT2_PLEWA|nr:hypothetical protein NDU88_006515 [Pleurodeles waltl]
MSVRLFDYNYVVQYLPGVKNMVADFLSRMPLPSNDTDEFQNSDEDGKDDMWVTIVEEGVCNGIMRDEWNTEQNLDEGTGVALGTETGIPKSHMWKEWLEEKNEGREEHVHQCQYREDSGILMIVIFHQMT